MGGHIDLDAATATYAEVAQCHINMDADASYPQEWWVSNAAHFASMASQLKGEDWSCGSDNFMEAHNNASSPYVPPQQQPAKSAY